MFKRLIAAILIFALLLPCFTMVGSAAATYSQTKIEQKLQTLMEQYCGTYWYGNYMGAIQCKGFADMIFNELFGTGSPGPYSANRYYLPEAESRSCVCLGILTRAESNYDSLRTLLSQARPGDYVQCVRYTGTQHSMIVVSTSDYGITFFDCNLRGSYLCSSYTYTWDQVAAYLNRGISLYRHTGYTVSKTYSLYFDAAGGSCDMKSKKIAIGRSYGILPEPERKGYSFDYWYIEEFNDTNTPAKVRVNAKTVKTDYSDVYLKAHWSKDTGPCAETGHTWSAADEVAASCETDGYWRVKCETCGITRITQVSATSAGHSYQEFDRISPTNVTDGEVHYECTVCGVIYTETTQSLLHRMTDLNEKSWYYPYVREMVSLALMTGTSSTTFEPDMILTRGQLVTILYRMQGEPKAKRASFVDVPAGKYYTAAIGWASEAGVVNGCPGNTFLPDDPVTREQVATILYRYAPLVDRSTANRSSINDAPDAAEISSYARKAMSWAKACGILTGYPDHRLGPKDQATRAQIAKMVIAFRDNTTVLSVK